MKKKLLRTKNELIKSVKLKATNTELIDESFKYTEILLHFQKYYIDMGDIFLKIIYDIDRIDNIILNVNDLIKREINLSNILNDLNNEKTILIMKIYNFLNILYKQLLSINNLKIDLISS